MNLVVISPEQADPRECEVLGELFVAGLERYHLRKPTWSREQLERWIRTLPSAWYPRIVLHQHHELVETLRLGGCHWRDDGAAPLRPARDEKIASRSCHDLATLRASLGHYDSVFFGPVFPSLSKAGHGPAADAAFDEISSLLANRTPAERRTAVLALGGITANTAPRAVALGFDGVAVLGAIWQAADPVAAFTEIHSSLTCHVA
jgi:thiamine-phosphate pyrophosphorylase